jgi:hypothetical protein
MLALNYIKRAVDYGDPEYLRLEVNDAMYHSTHTNSNRHLFIVINTLNPTVEGCAYTLGSPDSGSNMIVVHSAWWGLGLNRYIRVMMLAVDSPLHPTATDLK